MAQDKKKNRRSIAVVCAAAVLIVVGSTVAFFSSRDETTNRFAGNRFDIILTETEWNPNAAYDVVPGDELPKNPQVTNNEQTPGYIFLRVTVPCYDTQSGSTGGNSQESPVPIYKFMIRNHAISDENDPGAYDWDAQEDGGQNVHSQWTLVDGPDYHDASNTMTYVYAYSRDRVYLTPLKEGETTEPLFDKLRITTFHKNIDYDRNHNVLVEAFGIQSVLPGFPEGQIPEGQFWDVWQLLVGGEGG